MAALKLEGTFHLDGLIEGPVFSQDDENLIKAFLRRAQRHGIAFHLSTDGGRFSLLPDTSPVRLPPTARSADALIVAELEKWLAEYTPEERSRIMSTLRSVEYVPRGEKLTLYGIHPAGKVTVEQRTIEADTIPPAPPPDLKAIARKALLAAAVLVILIAVSALFVPYRAIAAKTWRAARPLDPKRLIIDAAPYADFLQIGEVALEKKSGMIMLTLVPTQNFPRTEEQFDLQWNAADASLHERLAIEAMARGYLTCEFFDEKGAFISHHTCRMLPAKSRPELFYILVPWNRSVHRIRIK